jgi:Putative zinc-finger
MDHSQAIQMKAAERYVLGELPNDLREQYEEHFFGCAECAEELNLAAAFVENTRAVLAAQPVAAPARVPVVAAQRPASSGWFSAFLRPSFAVPVFAALLLVVAYQSFFLIPHLKGAAIGSVASSAVAPQELESFSLITANTRGGEPLLVTVAPGQLFGLYFDIPPDEHYSSYSCQFENGAGAVEYSLNITAEQAKNAVQVVISSSTLGPGQHALVVRGVGKQESASGSGTDVARYPFTLAISR